MVIDDIQKFCLKLREIGKEHCVKELFQLGVELENDVDLFDISATEKK